MGTMNTTSVTQRGKNWNNKSKAKTGRTESEQSKAGRYRTNRRMAHSMKCEAGPNRRITKKGESVQSVSNYESEEAKRKVRSRLARQVKSAADAKRPAGGRLRGTRRRREATEGANGGPCIGSPACRFSRKNRAALQARPADFVCSFASSVSAWTARAGVAQRAPAAAIFSQSTGSSSVSASVYYPVCCSFLLSGIVDNRQS